MSAIRFLASRAPAPGGRLTVLSKQYKQRTAGDWIKRVNEWVVGMGRDEGEMAPRTDGELTCHHDAYNLPIPTTALLRSPTRADLTASWVKPQADPPSRLRHPSPK